MPGKLQVCSLLCLERGMDFSRTASDAWLPPPSFGVSWIHRERQPWELSVPTVATHPEAGEQVPRWTESPAGGSRNPDRTGQQLPSGLGPPSTNRAPWPGSSGYCRREGLPESSGPAAMPLAGAPISWKRCPSGGCTGQRPGHHRGQATAVRWASWGHGPSTAPLHSALGTRGSTAPAFQNTHISATDPDRSLPASGSTCGPGALVSMVGAAPVRPCDAERGRRKSRFKQGSPPRCRSAGGHVEA